MTEEQVTRDPLPVDAVAGRSNDDRIVGLLLDAFEDLDAVLVGLSEKELIGLPLDGSRFAWTYGHVASQLDGWINVRFQNADHDLVLGSMYGMGSSGVPPHPWPEIQEAVRRIRAVATTYLVGAVLSVQIPYDGSFMHLREHGLHIAHAVLRLAAHHYVHVGEIVAIRKRLGHDVGEPPRLLERTV